MRFADEMLNRHAARGGLVFGILSRIGHVIYWSCKLFAAAMFVVALVLWVMPDPLAAFGALVWAIGAWLVGRAALFILAGR